MTKLVLASCTADLYLYVDHLPTSAQDVKVISRQMALGGCGYHVSKACPDSILVCPIGNGMYAQFVKEKLLSEEIETIMPTVLQENGVCICLIEPNGQRTFLSSHGAEYFYTPQMLVDLPQADWIYISGIDLEEKQNQCLIDYCAKTSSKIFFAPGPRISAIPGVLKQMLDLKPVLHMNKEECEAWCQCSFQEGMVSLFEKTQKPVIVTDASRGSYAYDGKKLYHEVEEAVVTKNATGAGDTHAASCLDSLSQQIPLDEMLRRANRASIQKITQGMEEL